MEFKFRIVDVYSIFNKITEWTFKNEKGDSIGEQKVERLKTMQSNVKSAYTAGATEVTLYESDIDLLREVNLI